MFTYTIKLAENGREDDSERLFKIRDILAEILKAGSHRKSSIIKELLLPDVLNLFNEEDRFRLRLNIDEWYYRETPHKKSYLVCLFGMGRKPLYLFVSYKEYYSLNELCLKDNAAWEISKQFVDDPSKLRRGLKHKLPEALFDEIEKYL